MELNEIKNWYIKNEKLFFASIELTQNCNFNCKHCYCTDKKTKNLKIEDYFTIIDKLCDSGCLFLNFTGGEILTNKDFEKIYRYAKNKGFLIELLTNISLLDNQTIELFKELPPHNIAVTLYGTNKEEYAKFTGNSENYYNTLKALDLLKDNKIPFVLRTVASKTFFDSLLNGSFEKIARERYSTSFKFDSLIFPKTNGDISPLSECLSTNEIVKLEKSVLERELAWENLVKSTEIYSWSCNAGINSMAIDYKGNAYVCGLYRKSPISIIENDIATVQNHLKEIHKKHIEIMKSNECSKCEYRRLCKSCPAYSNIYNDNDNEKIVFFCDNMKALVNEIGKQK